MSDFELSNYQKDIMNFVATEKQSNLLVDAKAGSGKTSTLILVADELTKSGSKCLFLAFNKHIVEELEAKISNPNCLVKTVHSLGNTFIKSYLYKKHQTNYKLEIDKSKLRNLVKAYYEKHLKKRLDLYNATGCAHEEDITSESINANPMGEKELKDLHSEIIGDLADLCNYSRLYNIDYKHDKERLDDLVKDFCWHLAPYIDDVFDNYQDLVIAVLDKTKEMFENPEKDLNGTPIYKIDFTDMIYFPVLYNMQIPYSIRDYIQTVLVDESQDLSVLQQKFICKLDTNYNRFIFVGDKKQSIYAFAGADVHAIDKLKDIFVLNRLPLNVCYRCPENVVRLAQEIVPDIEWNKARTDKGEVKFVTLNEVIENIKPNDVLIGRKNKDLLQLYRKFVLDLKKPVRFRNKELVNTLVNNLDYVMKEYIKKYTRGVNIEKPLKEHMEDYSKETGENRGSDLYNYEVESYSRELISQNTGKSDRKNRSNTNIKTLETAMQEYYEFGAYGLDPSDKLTEFFDVLYDFIVEYKKQSASVLVSDFIEYITSFLSGSIYDEVPIISSVHSMKGGEADNVYIYDYPRFPYKMGNDMTPDEFQQEKNLKYVAITRAKKNLYLVLCDTSEDNQWKEKNMELNEDSQALVYRLIK